MKFEVFTVVVLKIEVFWDMMLDESLRAFQTSVVPSCSSTRECLTLKMKAL
jgi:hypothetical protein